MRPLNLLTMIAALVVLTVVTPPARTQEPELEADNGQHAYKRTAESPASIEFTFKKAIYRTETYSEPYLGQVPYTRTETYTDWEWVTETKWECDAEGKCEYKSVTEYKQVEKTRTVTEWKEEMICCRTWQEEVFDHYWVQAVKLAFPADAPMNAGEAEDVTFVLAGSEKRPAVELKQKALIYRYAVASSKLENGVLNVALTTKPYVTKDQIGPKSIGAASIDFLEGGVELSIVDAFTHARVASSYRLLIQERKGTQVLGETTQLKREGKILKAAFAGAFDEGKDYVVTLVASRAGQVLSAPLTFTVEKTVKAEALDLKALKSASAVSSFTLVGKHEKLVLRFVDATKNYKTAKTKYQIKLTIPASKKGEAPVEIASAEFERLGVAVDKQGRSMIPLGAGGFKIPAETLKTFNKGKLVQADVAIARTSRRFPGIKLAKVAKLQVRE